MKVKNLLFLFKNSFILITIKLANNGGTFLFKNKLGKHLY